MGQERLLATRSLLQPVVTRHGERAVAREMAVGVGLADQPQFTPRHVGTIESNANHPTGMSIDRSRPDDERAVAMTGRSRESRSPARKSHGRWATANRPRVLADMHRHFRDSAIARRSWSSGPRRWAPR